MNGRCARAAVLSALVLGCAAPPERFDGHAGETVERVYSRSDLDGEPAWLEVRGATPAPARYELHSLAWRDAWGAHLPAPAAGPLALAVRDGSGRLLAEEVLRIGPARPAGERPPERWLAGHPGPRLDALPRRMRALGEAWVDLEAAARGTNAREPAEVALRRALGHAERIEEFARDLAPAWSPALRPPPPDLARWRELSRGLVADLAALAAGERPADGAALAAIERDRCGRCHLAYRWERAAARHPARPPAGLPPVAVRGEPFGEPGDARNGGLLFALHCRTCHGAGHAPGPLAELLETRPPDLADPGFLWRLTDRDLLATVLGGGEPRGRSRHMPAFGLTLSALDAWDVLAFLRSRVASPVAALERYEELTWGRDLALPAGAPDELARVSVFRGWTAGGDLRFVAVDPAGNALSEDATGRIVGPSLPQAAGPAAPLPTALALARARER